jgi:hypothetical protein
VVPEKVAHDCVFLRLREHNAALPAQPRLKDSTAMNLANAKSGMTMRLAKCQWKLCDSVGELLA